VSAGRRRRARRVSTRTIASFASTLILMGLIVVVFALDWQAALWAPGFDTPPPAPHGTFHMERVGDADGRSELPTP
jgi:hypothetical protein